MNESSLNEHATLLKCAEICGKSYSNPAPGIHDRARFRYVDPFWLEGGILGLVDDSDPNEAYVVFRGTSELGNWFLTNGQAYEVAPRLADEIANLAEIQGFVHQGFLRAFALLWLGADKIAFTTAKWQKFLFGPWITGELIGGIWIVRELIGAIWAFSHHNAFWVFFLHNWHLGHVFWLWARYSLLIIFIQIIIGNGYVQLLFSRENPVSKRLGDRALELGPPLRDVIADVKQKDIIFIGHSLGGAMAALAFLESSHTLPEDKHLWLITFGAPRIGDDVFANWFQNRFRGQYNLIAHPGDPVAYLPPSASLPKIALKHFSFWGSLLLVVYYVFWFPYKTLYGLRPGLEWAKNINWKGKNVGLAFKWHKLKAYCETFDRQ
jgi:hypothetical protein